MARSHPTTIGTVWGVLNQKYLVVKVNTRKIDEFTISGIRVLSLS